MDDMTIQRAGVDDAGEILALQKLAYVSEAEVLQDFTIPPLHQTLEDILAEFNVQVFLKAERENRLIGSVRGYLDRGTCHIGKLIVHPNHQNRGIGTRLLTAVELHFPDARRYELFTSDKSKKNLYLYRKCGYAPFRTEQASEKLTVVFLAKIRKENAIP